MQTIQVFPRVKFNIAKPSFIDTLMRAISFKTILHPCLFSLNNLPIQSKTFNLETIYSTGTSSSDFDKLIVFNYHKEVW